MKLLSIIAALAVSAPAFADNYKIDPSHTAVVFKISHFGFSNVMGMFPGTEGKFTIDEAKPEKSSLEFTINTEKVFTADEKRDKHLRSPDFFNTKQFPNANFKSKSVKKTGDKTYEIAGDLTLHGVTKPFKFTFHHMGTGKDPMGNIHTGGEVTTSLKRSDFGMNFMNGQLGDEVDLIINVEGTKI